MSETAAKAEPKDVLVTSVDMLPDLSACKRVGFDTETVSYDDDEPAVNPWAGHRIAGIAVSEPKSDRAWYIPIRHIGAYNEGLNLPLEPVLEWMRSLFGDPLREITIHNAKFDLRMVAMDLGRDWLKAQIADTMVLGRLVHSYSPSLKLDYLCLHYGLEGKDDKEIKQWLKAAKTKDYGKLPIRLAARYAIQDVRAMRMLRAVLEKKLSEHARPVWETEKTFTKVLLDLELDGVPVDRELLVDEWHSMVERLIYIQSRLSELAGWQFDPGKHADKNALLFEQLGVKPKFWTPTGKPRLNKADFETLEVPKDKPEAAEVMDLLRAWNYTSHFVGTYQEGWINRMDDADRLHTDMNQALVVTGRLSSSNPNIQNIPFEAERYIRCPFGYAIVAFDFSQVEYRVFGHYTNDPDITRAYITNPDADFHQYLADELGVQRQFAKTLNFAFLYGMGKKKLLKTLAAALSILKGEDKMKALGQMTMLVMTGGIETSSKAEAFLHGDEEALLLAAEQLYDRYHKRFPSIDRFQRDVGRVAKQRMWVRNMYGRVYRFDVHEFEGEPEFERQKARLGDKAFGPHKAVNYLVQGSCADMLRRKLIQQHRELRPKYGSQLIMTVHDSVFWLVKRELAAPFYVDAKRLLETCPEIRVPIRADGKVSTTFIDADVDVDEGRDKPRGPKAKEKKIATDLDAWAWCTGGTKATEDDVVGALELADRAAHKSRSPVDLSKGYRVGRHG